MLHWDLKWDLKAVCFALFLTPCLTDHLSGLQFEVCEGLEASTLTGKVCSAAFVFYFLQNVMQPAQRKTPK